MERDKDKSYSVMPVLVAVAIGYFGLFVVFWVDESAYSGQLWGWLGDRSPETQEFFRLFYWPLIFALKSIWRLLQFA